MCAGFLLVGWLPSCGEMESVPACQLAYRVNDCAATLDLEVCLKTESGVITSWVTRDLAGDSVQAHCSLSRQFGLGVRQSPGKVRGIDGFSWKPGTLDKITTMSPASTISLVLGFATATVLIAGGLRG